MELEIKFAPVGRGIFNDVMEHLGLSRFETVRMSAEYFDCEDGFLSKNRISVRNRSENGVSVYTMKCSLRMENGVAVREEEEIQTDDLAAAFDHFARNERLAPIVERVRSQRLVTVAKMDFTRVKCDYSPREGVVFEMSQDMGFMSGPRGQRGEICEMEIELKRGEQGDFDEVLERLRVFDLPVEEKSKLARAREL